MLFVSVKVYSNFDNCFISCTLFLQFIIAGIACHTVPAQYMYFCWGEKEKVIALSFWIIKWYSYQD
jgi:hypothetical protein